MRPVSRAHAAAQQVRAGRPTPRPCSYHYLGGWEGAKCQVGLRSRQQDPPAHSQPLQLRWPCYQWKESARGEEPDGDTSLHTWPWLFYVFPGPFHLPGQCRGSHAGPAVGRAELANNTFWGLEVFFVLFLIYGVIISNSLPIYEKHE